MKIKSIILNEIKQESIQQRIEKASSYCSDLLKTTANKLGYDLKDGGHDTENSRTIERWILFELDEDYEYEIKKLTKDIPVGLYIDIQHNAIDVGDKWKIISGEIYSYNEMGDKIKTIKKW